MEPMRYTKSLLKWVRNTLQKQDVNSSLSRPPGDISLDSSTSRSDIRSMDLIRHGPTMSLDNGQGQLIPCDSASSHCFVDVPDNTPLLDFHRLRPDPASTGPTVDPKIQSQHPTQGNHNQDVPFRVIIVGSGPTGLIQAHALHQAGIEYTLLQRSPNITDPETDNDNGTSLIIWPNSARILDQLGLLHQAQKLSCPMRTRQTSLADGTPRPSKDDAFSRAKHDHGRPCMLIDRAALLRLLWETLPGRGARVRLGKEVVSVETHTRGVRVVCADGSFEEGSVVVGCDGVHGVVRRAMCELRAEGKKGRRFGLARLGGNPRAQRTMEARYYGLVGSAPLLDGLEAGVCYETCGDATGKIFQVLTSEDTAHFLVYIRLYRPTNRQIMYPAENADRLASAQAGHPITDKIKFGDLWRPRRSGRMVDFSEGMAYKWYHERVVLAGDAAHGMMPVLGLGVNTGWQDVVELTNGLRRLLLLHSRSGSHGPDTVSIKKVFKEYQAGREDHARTAALISSFYARAVAQLSPLSAFCRWSAPAAAEDIVLLDRQTARAVRQGNTLEYMEEKHFKEGKLKWVNPRRRIDTASAEEQSKFQTVWVHPGIPIRISAN